MTVHVPRRHAYGIVEVTEDQNALSFTLCKFSLHVLNTRSTRALRNQKFKVLTTWQFSRALLISVKLSISLHYVAVPRTFFIRLHNIAVPRTSPSSSSAGKLSISSAELCAACTEVEYGNITCGTCPSNSQSMLQIMILQHIILGSTRASFLQSVFEVVLVFCLGFSGLSCMHASLLSSPAFIFRLPEEVFL